MKSAEMPCIRCGACVPACPAGLQPQQLLFDLRAGQLSRAEAHGIADCNACGACDAVCPSAIPLHVRFVAANASLAETHWQRQLANAARVRFEKRNARLQRDAAERARREATQATLSASMDAVAAAIERANARRQQQQAQGDS